MDYIILSGAGIVIPFALNRFIIKKPAVFSLPGRQEIPIIIVCFLTALLYFVFYGIAGSDALIIAGWVGIAAASAFLTEEKQGVYWIYAVSFIAALLSFFMVSLSVYSLLIMPVSTVIILIVPAMIFRELFRKNAVTGIIFLLWEMMSYYSLFFRGIMESYQGILLASGAAVLCAVDANNSLTDNMCEKDVMFFLKIIYPLFIVQMFLVSIVKNIFY